jgi:hypothetical protein
MPFRRRLLTPCVPLTSVDAIYEAAQTVAVIVRDEEAAGSNPATPTQVNRRSQAIPNARISLPLCIAEGRARRRGWFAQRTPPVSVPK